MKAPLPQVHGMRDQLNALDRERERLEQLLMDDANWRALTHLKARMASGETLEAEYGATLLSSLQAALADNKIYAAHQRIAEAIELLIGADMATCAPATVPQDPTIVTMRPKPRPMEPEVQVAQVGQDQLDGLGGITATQRFNLRALGVTTLAQLAIWSDAECHHVADLLELSDRQIVLQWRDQARRHVPSHDAACAAGKPAMPATGLAPAPPVAQLAPNAESIIVIKPGRSQPYPSAAIGASEPAWGKDSNDAASRDAMVSTAASDGSARVDAARYAGYRDQVEEATVTIVRRAAPVDSSHTASSSASPTRHTSARRGARRATPGSGKAGRSLTQRLQALDDEAD